MSNFNIISTIFLRWDKQLCVTFLLLVQPIDFNFFLSHVYYLWLHSDLLRLFNIFNGFKGLHKNFSMGLAMDFLN
jgi:hypothetical protein